MCNPQSWFPNPHPLREKEGILGQSPAPNPLPEQDGLIPSHPSPGLISFPPFPPPGSRPSTEGVEVREGSGCLGARVHLLVGPELLVLLPAKALIVVAFALKQLLEVGFAVKFPVQSRVAAQAQLGVTVLAAEA